MSLRFIPFLALIAFALLLATGLLEKDIATSRMSHMIGRSVQDFTLPALTGGTAVSFADTLRSEVTIVNFFASWCESCVVDHAALMRMKERYNVRMIGIGWRDKPEALRRWLDQRGDPYDVVLVDEKGLSTVPLGLSGVPETFIFDKNGVIAYNIKMPLDESEIARVLMPTAERLRRE